MRSIFKLILLSVTMVFALGVQAEARNFQEIIKSGELRVGVSLYAPWVMRGKDKLLIGSEPDMARRLASDMGLKVILKDYEWNQLIPALKNGDIDVIASGMAVTPERALQVNFSQSYGASGVGLASNIALTKNIKTMKDMQNPKVKVGAVAGTIGEGVAKRLFKQATIKLFFTVKEAGDALVKGDIHALAISNPQPRFLALKNPDVIDNPLSKPLLNSREAFAIRKGDVDLLNFLNAWVVAREADAWIGSTRHYWFETLRWKEMIAQ